MPAALVAELLGITRQAVHGRTWDGECRVREARHSARGFCAKNPSPLQGPEEAIPGGACEYCGQPVPRRRRGRPGKFHPACRRAFDREARRTGGQVLRRRRARASLAGSIARLDAVADQAGAISQVEGQEAAR